MQNMRGLRGKIVNLGNVSRRKMNKTKNGRRNQQQASEEKKEAAESVAEHVGKLNDYSRGNPTGYPCCNLTDWISKSFRRDPFPIR